jgi:spore maturation protein CgeB
MKIVFLGLSITSSWGNGHATNYRALVRALTARGHDVLFLERDAPWYAAHRDLPEPPWGRTELYASLDDLRSRFSVEVAAAELVVVGSYVPQGAAVAEWTLEAAGGAVAFWDIDTPVTVGKLNAGADEYLSRALVPRFDLYLSFTGGPLLDRIEKEFGARRARPFYCMADAEAYGPVDAPTRWLLGYLGTYSVDRQPALKRLLLDVAPELPAERFVVAGPQYPEGVDWPENVDEIDHVAPADHPRFYAQQRFTLNVTRAAMVEAGWSPSVRLFETAACGVAAISDPWPGLDSFFRPGEEILVADSTETMIRLLRKYRPEDARVIGEAARRRVLAEHTPERRAEELEAYVRDVMPVPA